MAQFAIPGLMPSTHPNYDSRCKANPDGSLSLVIYETVTTDNDFPAVKFIVIWAGDTKLATDLTGDTVFEQHDDDANRLVIRLDPGILPVGMCNVHVELNNRRGTVTHTEYIVEVPKSPFHVHAPFDPAEPTREIYRC